MRRKIIPIVLTGLLAAACSQPVDQALRYRLQAPPPSLDPVRAADNNSLVYIYLLFDGLMEFVPGSLEARPAIAESYTVSEDGLTYTFTLRDDATFHIGRRITAEDVVYSLRRALTKETRSQKRDFLSALAGAAAFWDGETTELPGVRAIDDKTVVLTLDKPYPAFLTVLATEAGSIVPREVYDDPEEGYLRHPVGSGPFRFEVWDPDISITLKRHNGHWKRAPEDDPIETIRVVFIRDDSTALEEYRAGNIDFMFPLPPGQRQRVRQAMPGHLNHTTQLAIFYLGFNHALSPLGDNPLLRRAVRHAIDTSYIVEQLNEGKDRQATGVIPPNMIGHQNTGILAYDPERGRRLLAEAGYPEGEGLPELVLLSNDTQAFRRIAERIQTNLAGIGVRMRIKLLDFGGFLAELTGESGPDATLYRMTVFADYPDPDNFLGLQFTTGGDYNFGKYSNPAFDAIMDRAKYETDLVKRADLYRQADSMLLQDAALVPIYWYGQDLLLRPVFTGLKTSPLGAFAVAWEEMSHLE